VNLLFLLHKSSRFADYLHDRTTVLVGKRHPVVDAALTPFNPHCSPRMSMKVLVLIVSRVLFDVFRSVSVRLRAAVVMALVLLVGAALPAHGTTFPLKVSANGRYLVDQNNVPFRIQGDSPWDLLV